MLDQMKRKLKRRQRKRRAIINDKHGMCELTHELLNGLRLGNPRKSGDIKEISKNYEIIA